MRYFMNVAIDVIPDTHPVSVFNTLWQSVVGDGVAAPWSAFRPQEIADILPWLLLLERQGDGRYYYRVCGTACENLFGMTYQGKFFGDDLPPSAVRKRREEFDRIEAGEGPVFSATTLPIPTKEDKEIYRGVFGFSSDGEEVDRIGVVIAPK